MSTISELTSTALNSGLSSYYRKDAIRQLARLQKSAEMSTSVIKLLKDMENDSLQRDVMDLAVSFAMAEAVNLVIPLAIGKSNNARFAVLRRGDARLSHVDQRGVEVDNIRPF